MSVTEFPRFRGLRLGPEVNDFNDVDQATTEAARDSYFTSNPANLAIYDANSSLMIRLTYLDGEDLVTRFQVRLAGSWVDYTPVVQGPPGDVASLANVQIGEIPYKLIDGTFGGSNMRVLDGGSILAPSEFLVESGSIGFGEVLTISEVSGFLGITNHLNDNLYTVIDFNTPRDRASDEPHIFYLTSGQLSFTAQGVDTTNLPDNPLTFNYTIQNTARSHSLTFRTYAPMTNVRAKISLVSNGVALKYFPSRQAWEEGFDGINWVLGDNVVDFTDTPLNLEAGTEVVFELHADTVALKGNALGVPYFTAMIQPGIFVPVITENVYTAADIRDKLTSLIGINRLSGTALKDNVTSVNTRVGDILLDKSDVDLSNVDNTSDANKPVSTAQALAISTSMSNHLAAVDPHPQYTTTAEAAAAAPLQSATSIGTGSAVYKQTSSGNLEFRRLNASGNISIVENANDITFSVPTPPVLADGTYTPTLTNIANITAATSGLARWLRLGNTVTVSGFVTIDPTNPNQNTEVELTLPVASNFTTANQLAGVVSSSTIGGQVGGVFSNPTTDRVVIQYVAASGTNAVMYYQYTYTIL